MIQLQKIRELDLAADGDPPWPPHLSAASGLVCPGATIYVVADDELHLGTFAAGNNMPGRFIRLFPGELPVAKAERKRLKPDLEAITALPPFGGYPHGALLALGSGSKRNRRLGALMSLDERGEIVDSPRVIDFSGLFTVIDHRFPALNIEGALISGDAFCLLQRANKRHPQNAIIRLPLSAMLAALSSGKSVGAIIPTAINLVDLGQINDVPLSLTDGASLPNGGMVLTAVAEDTEDTYNDGVCLGAAIAIAAPDGSLRHVERLAERHKVEGVSARVDGDVIRLLLVTDADDPQVPAGLFAATLPNVVF